MNPKSRPRSWFLSLFVTLLIAQLAGLALGQPAQAAPTLDGSFVLAAPSGLRVYPDTEDCAHWYYDFGRIGLDSRYSAASQRFSAFHAPEVHEGGQAGLVSEYRWGASAIPLDNRETAAALAGISARLRERLALGDGNFDHCQNALATASLVLSPTGAKVLALRSLRAVGALSIGFVTGDTRDLWSVDRFAQLVLQLDATNPQAEPATWQELSAEHETAIGEVTASTDALSRSVRATLVVGAAVRAPSLLKGLATLSCKSTVGENPSPPAAPAAPTAPTLEMIARYLLGEEVPNMDCESELTQEQLEALSSGLQLRSWTPGTDATRLQSIRETLVSTWLARGFEITIQGAGLRLKKEKPEAPSLDRLSYKEALPALTRELKLTIWAPSYRAAPHDALSVLLDPAIQCQRAHYAERREKYWLARDRGIPLPLDWTLCSQN